MTSPVASGFAKKNSLLKVNREVIEIEAVACVQPVEPRGDRHKMFNIVIKRDSQIGPASKQRPARAGQRNRLGALNIHFDKINPADAVFTHEIVNRDGLDLDRSTL